MRTGQKQFFLAFVRKEKVAEDTYFFYFDLAERGFVFLPGQYIDMVLPHKDPDNRGIERSFTIASSPLDKKYLMVTTKTIKSSFKKALMDIKPLQPVKFTGPWGGFIFKEEEVFPRVFLAGGIGITTFYSMIVYAYLKKLSIPITLIASFSTREHMVFYKELSNISKENLNIKVIYTITHPDSQWKGEIGRISEELIKKYVSNILDKFYYIVGPPNMVSGIEEVVLKMGVPNDRVFIENFTEG